MVTATLASQSLDSNAALGNIDLGYKYHWWDGAALPIGLGLSLVLNGASPQIVLHRVTACTT